MRHVSRTHRVALDWLFDRINLDPKIQIKYIGTKNQLADILTKGNFTRDEWNHLLCLFNLSHFSSTVWSAAMAKGLRQESFMIPSSDQDMDDVTLGKLLTEAHRGRADYCNPEGVSVSQSSSSVVFDRAGKPARERDVDQSIGFWCHEKHVQCSQQVF